MQNKREIFRGTLLGLAVGDAMGFTVDRKTLSQIREDYGPNGLLGYDLVNGYAEITSYTQVAAFTANALLLAQTRKRMELPVAPLPRYVGVALREWSRSQQYCEPERNYCWLSTLPELKRRRCMDTRMLDALNRETLGTVDAPVYRSDAPGSLTTVITAAMLSDELGLFPEELDRLAAEIVAMTHGDPAAFVSGAALAHMMNLLLHHPEMTLEQRVKDTLDAMQLQYGRSYPQTGQLMELTQLALTLADSQVPQMEAMERLRCSTAPEVLAGALYACATCHGDFDAAMITAVNHSGRSSAVGAITGAALGARMGAQALPEFYMECLEPAKLLQELADDMTQGCTMTPNGRMYDDDWDRKYLHAGK